MKNSETDRCWPALVRSGERFTTALMNRKAFQKSMERGSPWVVHPATGRVLPWPGHPPLISLKEEAGRYVLAISPDEDLNPYGSDPPPKVNPDKRENAKSQAENIGTGTLYRLAKRVSERHRTMTEGSYTSHLFQSGADKIRKKIGEEAVELLLALTDEDIIYETADLIYHIQVLLEAMDLNWSDVEGELERRLSD